MAARSFVSPYHPARSISRMGGGDLVGAGGADAMDHDMVQVLAALDPKQV